MSLTASATPRSTGKTSANNSGTAKDVENNSEFTRFLVLIFIDSYDSLRFKEKQFDYKNLDFKEYFR